MSVTSDLFQRTVLPVSGTGLEQFGRVAATGIRTRIVSVDLMRGVVMVLMALVRRSPH